MSPKERILSLLKGNHKLSGRVVCPQTDRLFVASVLKKQIMEVTIQDELQVASICGYDPIVIVDFVEDNPELSGQVKILQRDNSKIRKQLTFATPFGDLIFEFFEFSYVTPQQISYPMKTVKDYKALKWYVKKVQSCRDSIKIKLQKVREYIGEKALISLRTGCPFELFDYLIPYLQSFTSLENRIFLYHDFPELYKELMEEIFETEKFLIDTTLEAGVNCFFFGSFGTEVLSPRIFEEAILPYAKKICRYICQKDGYSYYHACGQNKEWIDMGFFNAIKPSLLEGFAPPPSGNVDNLQKARERIDKDICTKGNLDIGILKNGSPDRIRKEVKKILYSTEGYDHIVGTACATLFGTPVENVREMVKACKFS